MIVIDMQTTMKMCHVKVSLVHYHLAVYLRVPHSFHFQVQLLRATKTTVKRFPSNQVLEIYQGVFTGTGVSNILGKEQTPLKSTHRLQFLLLLSITSALHTWSEKNKLQGASKKMVLSNFSLKSIPVVGFYLFRGVLEPEFRA